MPNMNQESSTWEQVPLGTHKVPYLHTQVTTVSLQMSL